MGEGATDRKDKTGRAPMTIIGDAIHAETIRKELRNFRLNETFILSPTAMKNMVLSSKPNNISKEASLTEVPAQPAVIVHGALEIPRTTSSTYGWDTVPLMRVTDRRFYHPKQVTEITKMYGTALKEKKSEKEAIV